MDRNTPRYRRMTTRLAACMSCPPDEAMAPRPLLELLGRILGIQRLAPRRRRQRSFLAAGGVAEVSLLVAPAIDGALGITGVFEVPDATGLAGKVRLRFRRGPPSTTASYTCSTRWTQARVDRRATRRISEALRSGHLRGRNIPSRTMKS